MYLVLFPTLTLGLAMGHALANETSANVESEICYVLLY